METSPDELWSPDAVDPYNLVPDLAAMQDTVQDALTANKTVLIGTNAERLALAAPAKREGVQFRITDADILWEYDGSSWKYLHARFGDIAAATTAIALGAPSAGDTAILASGSLIEYDGSAWRGGDGVGFTYAGGYSSSLGSPALVRPHGRRAYMEGFVVSVSTTFTGGVAAPIGSFPSDLAPATDQTYITYVNGVLGIVGVGNDGVVVMASSVTFTGVLSLALSGINWAIG